MGENAQPEGSLPTNNYSSDECLPTCLLLCKSSVASVLSEPSPEGSLPTARTGHVRHCHDLRQGRGGGRAGRAGAPAEVELQSMKRHG